MKRYAAVASLTLVSLLAACQKKDKTEEVPAVAATAPAPAAASATPAATPAVPPGEQTPEQQEMAKKKTLLDYSVMEDKYLNDIRAQWATTARASSVYGDDENKPNEHNLAVKATGPTDGNQWTNNSTDKGFDWLETGFAKPVNATEVRAVITGGQGVEAISAPSTRPLTRPKASRLPSPTICSTTTKPSTPCSLWAIEAHGGGQWAEPFI